VRHLDLACFLHPDGNGLRTQRAIRRYVCERIELTDMLENR